MRKLKSNKSDTFANRLKSLMITRQLTQQKVADAAHVSRTAVVKWLRGSVPGAGELFDLATANSVSVEWFLQAIPYEPIPNEVADKMPIRKAPSSAIPPELRPEVAAVVDLLKVPGAAEALSNVFSTVLEQRKDTLDKLRAPDKLSGMRSEVPTWPELKKSIKQFTAARGEKIALATELGISRQVLGNWLSAEKQGTPNADLTLRLLWWVKQKQRKK